MKNSPIKQIKKTQFNIIQLILTTVLIASGVNFLVTGAVSHFENKSGSLLIIIGISLIVLTVIISLIIDFKKSKIKEIINAVISYDPQKQELIKIPKYKLSEDLIHYLNAACIESKDIFLYTIMHNILNDLICKTDLISIKVDVNGLVTYCLCCRRFGRKTVGVALGCGRSREDR